MRAGGDVRCIEQGRYYGDAVRAGADDFGGVLEGNAADRDQRYPECARLPEQRERRSHRAWLGRRGIDAAKGDVIRAGGDCAARDIEAVIAGCSQQAGAQAYACGAQIAVAAANIVRFVGTGETLDDLAEFDAEAFVEGLFE